MLDTASSFGSASSAPSLSSLPPIRVRPDDRPPDLRIAGHDDRFAHMNFSAPASAGGGQRLDDDFKEPPYAPQLQPSTPIPLSASSLTISPTENPSRVFSDDEDKSDHGVIGKPPPPQQPSKPTHVEVAVSDSGSRTTHLNATPDPRRELVSSIPSYRVPIPATDAAGFQLPSLQPEQFQQQQLHPQLHQQQQQQYIPANPHYIHHPATSGVIPVPTYFPIAAHTIQQPPQAHPYCSQFPLYYYPVQQTPSYNLAAAQPGLGDPNSISSAAKLAMPRPQVPGKAELPANLYRAAAPSPAATLQPPLIQLAADQAHSYAGMGYHVVQQHHLSQPPAPMVNYGYEFAVDHTQPQMYYSQTTSSPALAPQLHPVSSGVVVADATAPADVKATRAS